MDSGVASRIAAYIWVGEWQYGAFIYWFFILLYFLTYVLIGRRAILQFDGFVRIFNLCC